MVLTMLVSASKVSETNKINKANTGDKSLSSFLFFFLVLLQILLLILTLFVTLSLFGCSYQGYQKAKDFVISRFTSEKDMEEAVKVVEKFFNAIMERDYEVAYKYISTKDKNQRSFDDFKNEFRNVTDIVSVEAKWVEVKNNVAIVGIDLIDFYDGEEKIYKDIEVSLIKEEDGSWKINFWD